MISEGEASLPFMVFGFNLALQPILPLPSFFSVFSGVIADDKLPELADEDLPVPVQKSGPTSGSMVVATHASTGGKPHG